MALKLSNNGVAKLVSSISSTATSFAVTPGAGALFPALSTGDWCPITVLRSTGALEIMYVTAISGDIFTVQRGKESTVALAFSTNDRIEQRATAGAFDQYVQKIGGNIGPINVDGAISASGDVTLSRLAAPTTGYVYLGNAGNRIGFDGANYLAGLNKIWTAGNFDPAAKADLNAPVFTGKISTASINSAMAADASSSIEVRNVSGATGESGLAMISFLCGGIYGIKMGLRSDGYFGLGGWSRAPWSFYSSATGDIVAAGNVSAYSDPRLKDDVQRIDGALDIIHKLDGVRFTWNHKTALIGRPGERDIGVLADQVEAVLPELVGRSIPDDQNGGEQWHTVAYDKLVPVLIEAMKELTGRVRELEAA